MSLTRFRCANSLKVLALQKCGTQSNRDSAAKNNEKQNQGAVRESNPRPLPPEGRIIPLDQRP